MKNGKARRSEKYIVELPYANCMVKQHKGGWDQNMNSVDHSGKNGGKGSGSTAIKKKKKIKKVKTNAEEENVIEE